MKKSLLAGVALAALIAAPAMAADLGVRPAPTYKAPPPVAAVYGWTGCYIGVEGGGAWGRSHHDSTAPVTRIAGDFDVTGGLVGGTVGCNFQPGGSWLIGVEGDFSWVSKNGNANDVAPFNTTFVSGTKEKWLGTARGRLGFVVNPQFLLYATGGFAVASVEADVTPTGLAMLTDTKTRYGWTLGGGVEWAFTPNLSAKLEYLYVQLQDKSYFDTPIATTSGTVFSRGNVSLNNNIARVGLNYKFSGF